MEIRLAKLEDERKVLELLDELGEEMNDKTGQSAHNTEAQRIGGPIFREIINRKDTLIFVAIEDNVIIGLATFYILPNIRHGMHRGHVEDIIVNKDMRGKGIGTKIFNAIKDFCKKNDIKVIKLDTNKNLEAHNFYLRNGGKQTELMYRFDLD
jgi:GNAT superfamily N-acetyltransferase